VPVRSTRRHRRVSRAALIDTWKHVSKRRSHFPNELDTLTKINWLLVNIVSRTYTARLAKERLEGQL